MRIFWQAAVLVLSLALMPGGWAGAQDIGGAIEHPMVSRYPGQSIRWQSIENFRPFRVPLGPVSGYREIADWADVEGRVTRSFYARPGSDRGYDEIFLNFRDAFAAQGFEIRAEGLSPTRRGPDVGSRPWLDVYLAANPFGTAGEVGMMAQGSSSQGGQGSFVAWRDRAAGPVWVVVTVEQHADDMVGTLIDIIELAAAEVGLVAVDPEAIGRDLQEKGRVVLDGIYFEFDSADLQPRSDRALEAVATYLRDHPEQAFYVVGHTDSRGGFEYNSRLSRARADSVVGALVTRYGISATQLSAHGVGPLVPVFSNGSDAGRARNRRVELVEAP